VADRSDGGDNTNPADVAGGGFFVGPAQAPEGECAAVEAVTLLANGAEIALAPQVLLRAETHGKGK
jgi:hypothetical protein